MTREERRKCIFDTIEDLCGDFLYYDRKEDEELTTDQLEDAVDKKIVTVEEMVDTFRHHLEEHFGQ